MLLNRSQHKLQGLLELTTANAKEIRDADEDGKRRMAKLAEQGKGLAVAVQ